MSYSTVYLVTSGEYSDYQVSLAFTTRELAQAWCDSQKANGKRSGYDEYEVEEYPLISGPLAPEHIVYARSAAIKDGMISHEREWTYEAQEWEAGYAEVTAGVKKEYHPHGFWVSAVGPDPSAVREAFRAAVAEALTSAAPASDDLMKEAQ